MPCDFYRIRSTDALLGKFQELERQEIYLASSQELNDPMEGYKDVFWLGDVVLWRNLFRHYMLNLAHAIIQATLTPDGQWEEPKLDVSRSLDDLPTPALREMFIQMSEMFFAEPASEAALRGLAALKHPLGPASVTLLLTALHPAAVNTVLKALVINGLIPEGSCTPRGCYTDF